MNETPRSTRPGPGAEEIGRSEQSRSDQAGALVMAARLAQKRGRRDEARAKLQQALIVNPGDCGALEAVGDMLLEEGEHEKAVQLFEKALKLHPEHRPFEERLAEAHIDIDEMRRDREVREEFQRTGEVPPDLTEHRLGRAMGLAFLVSGAGHYYIGEEDRAWWFGGAWLATLCAWNIPWLIVGKISNLNAFWHLWVLAMIAAFLAVYVWGLIDTWQCVERVKTARKQSLGI